MTLKSNSYLKRKNRKSVKRSKIVTQQQKAIENTSIADIKSVIIEHPKTSHKLSKIIRQAEKVSQIGSGKSSNSLLQSELKTSEKFLYEKNVKNNKSSTWL